MRRNSQATYGRVLKAFQAFSVVLYFPLAVTPTFADELPVPAGDVLLTVSGEIEHTNVGDTAEFDFNMLSSMPVQVIVTSTPWTEGPVEFSGVALADLVDIVSAEGNVLHARALNGYIVDIPVADIQEAGPIIAYLRDGKTISVREKGPLWIMYPFDDLTRNRELYFNRAIWQLRDIEVLTE